MANQQNPLTRYTWSINADVRNAMMQSGSSRLHDLQSIRNGLNIKSIDICVYTAHKQHISLRVLSIIVNIELSVQNLAHLPSM